MRQAIKNGIRCTLRTPGKTVLFMLVLTVLAALLAVAVCVCSAVQGYLRDCDEYFHTVADLEYIGRDYPAVQVYDGRMAEAVEENSAALNALREHPGVIAFEAAESCAAIFDGLHRMDRRCYDPDAAVLFVYILGEDAASNSVIGQIRHALYSRDDVEGTSVRIRTDTMIDAESVQPVPGNTYIMAGHFFRGSNNYLWFQAEKQLLPGEEEISVPGFMQIEGEIPEDSPYLELAGLMEQRNNSCRVQRTASLEDVLPFHQQKLLLSAGRSFTQEEYAASAHVCVVSDLIARMMDLNVGDTVALSLYDGAGDLALVLLDAPVSTGEYEIVGIYGAADNYADRIFLPVSGPDREILPVTGYRLGQFRLENGAAESFLETAQPLTEAGFRVTVYDQGWAAATAPMEELLLISAVFLGVCILLVMAAQCLLCWLFIARQRETARTMDALGSGRGHIYLYFICAVALISLPAAVIGGIVGKGLEQEVFRLLTEFTKELSLQDLRFSVCRITFARTLAFEPRIPAAAYCGSGGFLVFCAAGFSTAFTAVSLKNPNGKKHGRKQRSVRHPRRGRTSVLSGALKYGVLSMLRGGGRTAAVLLLGGVTALFFGQLTSSLEEYRAQLTALRENAQLVGQATDGSGQQIEELVIPEQMAADVAASGLLSSYSISDRMGNCRILGAAVTADGEIRSLPEPVIPGSSFALETFFAQMAYEPDWMRTNSVEHSYVFRYTAARDIRWLEGYSEADFASGGKWICALPHTVMEAHDLTLGDTVRILYAIRDRGSPLVSTADLLVAASYVSATESEVVFCPVDFSWRSVNNGYAKPIGGTYDSFVFTLEDHEDLDALRQTLEDAGFTPAGSKGKSRTYAVIDDEIYLNTTQSMERQIRYVGALYNSLYVLAGIMGFVLAWLLTVSRKTEIALLRALGTAPRRIGINFLFEQAVLCAGGLLLGTGLWMLSGKTPGSLQKMLTGAFFVCWTVSAGCSLAASLGKRGMVSLSEPE